MTFKIGAKSIAKTEQPADLQFWTGKSAKQLLASLDLRMLSPDDLPDVLEEFESPPTTKDKDVLANVRALQEVLGMVTFVVEAEEDNGTLYGYWHGPEGTPAKDAPIVSYDSEGTIELACGTSLSDVLVAKASYEDDEQFAELKAALGKHGIELSGDSASDYFDTPPCKTDPAKLHDKLYKQYKRAKS